MPPPIAVTRPGPLLSSPPRGFNVSAIFTHVPGCTVPSRGWQLRPGGPRPPPQFCPIPPAPGPPSNPHISAPSRCPLSPGMCPSRGSGTALPPQPPPPPPRWLLVGDTHILGTPLWQGLSPPRCHWAEGLVWGSPTLLVAQVLLPSQLPSGGLPAPVWAALGTQRALPSGLSCVPRSLQALPAPPGSPSSQGQGPAPASSAPVFPVHPQSPPAEQQERSQP